MRLLEVLPLEKLHRPFDAKKCKEKEDFSYFSLMRDVEAVAAINELTRNKLAQNEFLMITVMGGSTYLESGTNLNYLKPLAFFRSAFNCGAEDNKAECLSNILVNMTKCELSHELRSLIYGREPVWSSEYHGLKLLLCRKMAILPDYLEQQNTPVIHLPVLKKRGLIIYPQKARLAMA